MPTRKQASTHAVLSACNSYSATLMFRTQKAAQEKRPRASASASATHQLAASCAPVGSSASANCNGDEHELGCTPKLISWLCVGTSTAGLFSDIVINRSRHSSVTHQKANQKCLIVASVLCGHTIIMVLCQQVRRHDLSRLQSASKAKLIF